MDLKDRLSLSLSVIALLGSIFAIFYSPAVTVRVGEPVAHGDHRVFPVRLTAWSFWPVQPHTVRCLATDAKLESPAYPEEDGGEAEEHIVRDSRGDYARSWSILGIRRLSIFSPWERRLVISGPGSIECW